MLWKTAHQCTNQESKLLKNVLMGLRGQRESIDFRKEQIVCLDIDRENVYIWIIALSQ